MNNRIRPVFKEAIVVEGRDDEQVVSQACDALIITTHGFGISDRTWKLIDKAAAEKGLIILTDPDHAGETIRRRISQRHPGAKHAYIARDKAEAKGDIGVENASPDDVLEALMKARPEEAVLPAGPVTMADMDRLGLSSAPGSAARRERAAGVLAIGYGNAKAFLKKVNAFGITLEELERAVEGIEEKKDTGEHI